MRTLRLFIVFSLFPAILLAQRPDNSTQPVVTARPFPDVYSAGYKLNFIRTWEPSRPIDNPATVVSYTDVKDVRQATGYFDGLGRSLQTVEKGMSPVTKQDLVVPVVYDEYGRIMHTYMPYVSSGTDGTFKPNPFPEQALFLQGQYPGEHVFYGEIEFEASPLNRIKKSMVSGNNWAGSGKGVTQQYLLNAIGEDVRVWRTGNETGDYPSSTAAYLTGELSKEITADEGGNQSVSYKDKQGNVILKKMQQAVSPEGAHSGWLCTYYVYDDLNRLRYVLPPKAVEVLAGNNWNMTDPVFRKELCFRYEYDHRDRMILKQTPGTAPVEMVYDVRDRLILTRDGNLVGQNKWMVTLYDDMNRPVMTGLYASALSRDQLQGVLNPGSAAQAITHSIPATLNLVANYHDGRLEYKARQSIEFIDGFNSDGQEFETFLDASATIATQTIVANNTIPSLTPAEIEPLSYTYYDNYDYPLAKNAITDHLGKPEVGLNEFPETPVIGSRTKGLVTGSRIKVLGSGDQWLTTSTYYDEKSRVQQVQSDNITGGTDVITYLYDFEGKLLSSYQHHRNARSIKTPDIEVLTMNQYDHAGRVLNVVKQLGEDVSTRRTIATNTYDLLGQLKKKEFKRADNSVLESIEYDFNIRGWLRGINKNYANGNASHFFGEELCYDHGFLNKEYNGNIAGAIWKGSSNPTGSAYSFSYDRPKRLLRADFTQNNGGWSLSPNVNYSVQMGDGVNSSSAYDANGNIKRMQQWGERNGGSPLIDDLQYTYDNPVSGFYTNRLQKVIDNANDPSTTLSDFKDHNPGTATDYLYDPNGNLTKDENKQITNITHNYLNLPELITIPGKGSIRYVYDAAGKKQRKIVKDQTAGPEKITTTDYTSNFVYENDLLQFAGHEEGRIRAIYRTGQPVSFVYDYFMKDHLGNVRMVLTEQTDFSTYLASMEQANSAKENALFSNIDATRSMKPVGYPQDGTTQQNAAVARLNANNPDKKIGPSLVLKVMAGDTVQIGAKAFYKSTGRQPANKLMAPAGDILASLIKAFGGSLAQKGGKQANNVTNNTPFSPTFYNNDYQRLKEKEPQQAPDVNRPKAYLNFVLFDDQLKLVEENSGVKQVKAEPDQLQTLAQGKMVMAKSGFLYVYTSNESPQDVYFDNVVIMSAPGPVLEETHYYPFGLSMAGLSSSAGVGLENKYKFNDKELQQKEFSDGGGLELYEFGARHFDPQIGRWHSSDPMAGKWDSYSPYSFTLNSPILNVDPNGEDVYLFYWVRSDKKEDNSMFYQSALTRAADLLRTMSENDTYKISAVEDLGQMKEMIEGDVAELSPKFGGTKEFGIWSHAGFDGPIGSVAASNNALYDAGDAAPGGGTYANSSTQLNLNGWANINFNWVKDGTAKAGFYGCNTGNAPYGQRVSFTTMLSARANFRDVNILGQSSSSYPSMYTNVRESNEKMRNGNFEHQKIYMVSAGSLGMIGKWRATDVNPMRLSRNGKGGLADANGNAILQPGKTK